MRDEEHTEKHKTIHAETVRPLQTMHYLPVRAYCWSCGSAADALNSLGVFDDERAPVLISTRGTQVAHSEAGDWSYAEPSPRILA